jgi:biopolymer transport protein ExbD
MGRRLIDLSPQEEPENTLPLINIVFLLLIFFMIAGAIEKADLFEITPPDSTSAANPAVDPVKIGMSATGAFAYANTAYPTEDALWAALAQDTLLDRSRPVEIKADAAVDTQKLVMVLRQLQEQGFDKVTLLVSGMSASSSTGGVGDNGNIQGVAP